MKKTKELTLNEYQKRAMSTCMPSCNNVSYMKEELKKELGDILWQTAGLAHVMGWTLEDVAQMNLDKLAARKEAGTIDGNGDGIIRDK